jgi:hypothetical protein
VPRNPETEDTDAERNRPEWVEGIISALAAIGISRDDPTFEGPYFQSHSTRLHRLQTPGQDGLEDYLANGYLPGALVNYI